jgi:hypothetical protein
MTGAAPAEGVAACSSSRWWRHGCSSEPTTLGLRSTKSSSTSSYGTASTRQTCFAYLKAVAISGDFEQQRLLPHELGWHRGAPLVHLRLQDWDEKLPCTPLLLLDRSNCSKRQRKIEFEGRLGFDVFFNLQMKV